MNKIYLFFILLFYFFKCIFTQSASAATYVCLLSLTTRSGELSKVSLNSTSGKYEFCKKYQCNSNGDVSYGIFYSYVSLSFSQNDFACLGTAIGTMILYDFTLSSDFLTSTNLPTSLNTLYLYQCFGARINGPIFPSLKTLTYYPAESYAADIYFSSLKTLERYYQNDNTLDDSLGLKYINDLTSPITIPRGNSWIFESTSLPSMKNINITRVAAYSSNLNFDAMSYSNFSTYTMVNTIYIADLTRKVPSVQFPSSLIQLTNNVLKDITFYKSFLSPTSPISMSNWKYLENFEIHYCLPTFQFNGKIPFDLNTIPSTLKSFEFEDSNLYAGLPDFSLFNNVNELSLRNNSFSVVLPKWNSNNKIKTLSLSWNNLTGTIDESYCTVLLDVSFNKLTGTIPTCFTCYFVNLNGDPDDPDAFDNIDFQYLTSGFNINQFTGIDLYSNPPTCTTTVPNLRYDSKLGKTYLFGKDLGFESNYFTSSKYSFSLDVPSISFVANTPSAPALGDYIDFTFKFQTKVYRVSANPYPPRPTTISVLNDLFIIDGTYFSYNISTIFIDIGGSNCKVVASTFYQINCTTDSLPKSNNQVVPASINVNGLITQLPFPIKNNIVVDTTKCQSNSYCNFNGVCNPTDNSCTCDSKHTGKDCSDIQCTDQVCNSNQLCDNTNGQCYCKSGWVGENCTYPNHYATSALQDPVGSNSISIFGWFGSIHNNLNVTIGSTKCIVVAVAENIINCGLLSKPTSYGFQNVYINQNSIEWIGKNLIKYQEQQVLKISCFNDCSGNGICNTLIGSCSCSNGYTGLDCSSKNVITNQESSNEGNQVVEPPKSIRTIDTTNAISKITNSETIFEIFINKILEISFDGSIVKEWLLTNQWTIDNDNNSSSIYKFSQKLNETDCLIIYTIEEIENDKNYSFAGFTYPIEGGSLKMSIEISNYQYLSTLNNLQIQMQSKVGTTSTNSGESLKCNDENTIIKDSIDDNLLNFISIKKNGKLMYGRFLSLMLSDNRPTFMKTSIISNDDTSSIILGLNLPTHCINCLIDPDFSVLISTDFKSSCEENSDKVGGRSSYVIPVSVVASVIGIAAIITISVFVYKKKVQRNFVNKLKKVNTN